MKAEKIYGNEFIFPYIAFIPDNLADSPALIIQLHGAGERGDGGDELDRVTLLGLSNIVNDNNLKNTVLIMPQCPKNSFWAAKTESLKSFIDKMIEKYSADKSRIYLTGLSMGGFGTWYCAMAYPELFAAIAPCCGGGMAWNASVLTMPVYVFHGMDDTVVSVNQSLEMINALKGINPELKYEIYEGVAHNVWDKAYTEDFLGWLLSKHK